MVDSVNVELSLEREVYEALLSEVDRLSKKYAFDFTIDDIINVYLRRALENCGALIT